MSKIINHPSSQDPATLKFQDFCAKFPSSEVFVQNFRETFLPFCKKFQGTDFLIEDNLNVPSNVCITILDPRKHSIRPITQEELAELALKQHLERKIDEKIISELYETYVVLGKRQPNAQISVLEIGAGRTYPLDNNVGSPWLARWISQKHGEYFDVQVSDLERIPLLTWDKNVEYDAFNISAAFHLDYSDLPLIESTKRKHFIFGRHLNAYPEDQEIQDLELGLFRTLAHQGRCVIDFDGGPLLNYKMNSSYSFNTRSNYFEKRLILVDLIHPESTIYCPLLEDVGQYLDLKKNSLPPKY